MIDPGKWVEYLKLEPKHVLPVFFVSLFALFAPNSLLDLMGLQGIVEEFRVVPGILLLLSGAMLASQPSIYLVGLFANKHRHGQERKKRVRVLASLSQAEKELLRQYLQRSTKTLDLDIQDGTALGLVQAGVLMRMSILALGYGSLRSPFNLQQWAWDMLQANPLLLE